MQQGKYENAKGAISATVKALAKDKNLDVSFAPSNKTKYSISGHYLNLPFGNKVELEQARGLADIASSQIRFKDEDLHLKNAPRDRTKLDIYNALEQMRHSILLADKYKGVQDNMLVFLHTQIEQSIVADEGDIINFLGLAQYFKSQYSLPEKYLDNDIAKAMAAYNMQTMLAKASSQNQFQAEALKFIRFLFDEEEPTEIENQQDQDQSDDSSKQASEQEGESAGEQGSEQMQEADGEQKVQDLEDPKDSKLETAEDKSSLAKSYDGEAELPSGVNHYFEEGSSPTGYRIFTEKFDEVIRAEKLAEPQEILSLRHKLDEEIKRINVPYSRLFAKLYRLLISLRQSRWRFGQDEGYIDGARLASLVVKKDNHNIYKSYEDSPFADTIVSLLIDNSGSMRGRPIVTASACAEVLMRVLEQCKIKTEVLGFTTKEWKGGEAKKLWEKQVSKNKAVKKPGRLNDLRHIIYKSGDESARKASRNLGVMLKDGLLKENIDGEALIWAHTRLRAALERRKVLLVISDGAPVDDSTATANDTGFLSNHLQHIISQVESDSKVELLAIGIGHDVSRYYKNSVTIANVDELGDTLIEKLVQLFSK